MKERGWNWSSSEIRLAQLAEWLARQEPGPANSVVAFYEALPDQSMNTWDTAYSDLQRLERRSMIKVNAAMGGIPGLLVILSQEVRDYAEELGSTRANKRMRRTACRDAMVEWLYSLDAIKAGPDIPVRDKMLDNSRYGMWFGAPFTANDLDDASAWLERHGLVVGPHVAQANGPVRLYLTDAGVSCAEDYDSDTTRYVDAQARKPTSGPTVHIGNNSGPFQVAGDNAHQVQHIGADASELRKQIESITELVRQLVPDTTDLVDQEQAALAAATPESLDRSALRRFADWAVGIIAKGASPALVPAITAATTEMLNEAGRLAGHL